MSIYFVFGPLDITQSEFESHYIPQLENALKDSSAKFVVGDARGADFMAQVYLADKKADVTVYHMKHSPLHYVPGLKKVGGFQNHNAKDTAMTLASTSDIWWERSEDEKRQLYGSEYRKRKSGTQKNVERRKKNFVA